MKEYSAANMEKQNRIFSEFWKQQIEKRYPTGSVSMSFLLCIDMMNEELHQRLLDIQSVAQKKGRNRLAAVLTFDGVFWDGKVEPGTTSLTVLDSNEIFREKKKYREMRADFLKLMGLREQDNHRSYWGDEDDKYYHEN